MYSKNIDMETGAFTPPNNELARTLPLTPEEQLRIKQETRQIWTSTMDEMEKNVGKTGRYFATFGHRKDKKTHEDTRALVLLAKTSEPLILPNSIDTTATTTYLAVTSDGLISFLVTVSTSNWRETDSKLIQKFLEECTTSTDTFNNANLGYKNDSLSIGRWATMRTHAQVPPDVFQQTVIQSVEEAKKIKERLRLEQENRKRPTQERLIAQKASDFIRELSRKL